MANQAQEWLLTCLRGKPEKIKELSAEQWQEVIQQAARFSLMPLLYERLRHTTMPEESRQPLRAAYERNTFNNLRLYGELRQVFEAFKRAEIPVIVLKGTYLAQAIYPNIAARTMLDADLLVRKEDLTRAFDSMLALGYELPAEVKLSELHLPPFYKPGSKRIEIHWSILTENSPFKIDLEQLWERAQPVKIANVEVLGLSPEDLLLHLALHASYRHRFAFGIRPLCDINLTIRHYQEQLDWQTFLKRASLWRAGKALYLTLLLSQELLNAPIPPDVLSTLKPATFDPQLPSQAKEQLFAETRPLIREQTIRLWEAKGLRERSRLALESLFLPKEVMARLYSVPERSPRLYLYYLVRLKYLLSEHRDSLWQLFGRQDRTMISATEREAALLEWLSSPTDSVWS